VVFSPPLARAASCALFKSLLFFILPGKKILTKIWPQKSEIMDEKCPLRFFYFLQD
jgi:hypothetical protein